MEPAHPPASAEPPVARRTVLRWAGAAGMLAVAGVTIEGCSPPEPLPGTDPNGLVLPPGFTSRVIGRANGYVAGHQYRAFPDGGATFADLATPGGWYYVVNHEVPASGGVTSIRFAPDGTVVSATPILTGTSINCAGGATPWGTWLSCEEWDHGQVWECDPTAATGPFVRPAMGSFQHEAAALAGDGRVYLTEDRGDGGFYRFTPTTPGDLSAGVLEIATGASAIGTITWVTVPDPLAGSTACRHQVAGTVAFNGGEGIDTLGDEVWFTTKGDRRVWRYQIPTQQMSIRYQGGGSSQLTHPDNLLADDLSGVLVVAEDGGDLELVMIRPDNTTATVVRVAGQDGSEVTGPAFSPDGQRLYFNSQRGYNDIGLPLGITYEVTGPFDALLGR